MRRHLRGIAAEPHRPKIRCRRTGPARCSVTRTLVPTRSAFRLSVNCRNERLGAAIHMPAWIRIVARDAAEIDHMATVARHHAWQQGARHVDQPGHVGCRPCGPTQPDRPRAPGSRPIGQASIIDQQIDSLPVGMAGCRARLPPMPHRSRPASAAAQRRRSSAASASSRSCRRPAAITRQPCCNQAAGDCRAETRLWRR